MIKRPELSTDVSGSSAFDAKWAAHWNTAAMPGEARQFAIVRIVRKKTEERREVLPTEMQPLPADFIAVNDLHAMGVGFTWRTAARVPCGSA